MNKAAALKIAVSLLLLAGAGFGFYRYFNRDTGVSEQEFFYDLSEKKLFAAPRESLPPIRGLNDAEEDAVRAVVIAPASDPDNPAKRQIAYLEKYAPELKKSLEEVRAGKAEPLPSRVRNGYRFVRRGDGGSWHAVNTPEGEKILNDWNVPGPDGKPPVVCVP
jgi:hypothetical protein